MGLRDKIILGHIKSIVWFIVWWCLFCMSALIITIIALSIWRGDKIEEPMGPEHNWVVPTDSDTVVYETENILYWEWESTQEMDWGGEYHGKEGESEYGEYESSDDE